MMSEQHWNEAQQYTFTAALDSATWAWEFLRRNPEQGRLRRAGIIKVETVAGCRAGWTLMLRIHDGIGCGATPGEIAAVLGTGQPQPLSAADVMALHKCACTLSAGGYRHLLLVPA